MGWQQGEYGSGEWCGGLPAGAEGTVGEGEKHVQPLTGQRRSRGCGKEGGHHLPWGLPPEALAGAVIEELVNPAQVRLADRGERRTLRVQAPDQPVRVLVGPALPRVVRAGEVNVNPQSCGDLKMAGELLAVVERNPIARNANRG